MTNFPQNPDVIVVGAGTAGLSAAQSLREAGLDVAVLEASGRAGGRCITDNAPFSVPFDMGGSWLHSAPINPLARVAEQSQVPIHKTPWRWSRVQVDGYDLTADEVAAFCDYHEDMWEAIHTKGTEEPDKTTLTCLPDGPWVPTAAHGIAQMLGGDADVTSAKDVANYDHHEGDWLVEGGLGVFVQKLHNDVPVRTNCPVQVIDHSGPLIRVTTPDGVLEARHLIVTVSTGVLASCAITFVPPLSPAKQDAVDQLPMGLLNKVGIEFDPVWHAAVEGEMAEYHPSDDAFCSILFGFFGSPLAVGFVAGRFANALEKEGAGAATAFCREALRDTFGSSIETHIQSTDETAWRGVPHALGSYSYAKPGGAAARAVLARPIDARVFFAGEATMANAYATVHGAWQSGQRAAAEVLAERTQSSAPGVNNGVSHGQQYGQKLGQ